MCTKFGKQTIAVGQYDYISIHLNEDDVPLGNASTIIFKATGSQTCDLQNNLMSPQFHIIHQNGFLLNKQSICFQVSPVIADGSSII